MENENTAKSVGVTMADVGRLAKVHPTTVSRALRNDPRITDAVKARVREAVDKLGYRTNPLLSALSTLRLQRAKARSNPVVAYIMKEEAYLTDHLAGIRQTAEYYGYGVEVFSIGSQLSEKRLNQILVTRGINGLILAPLPEAHGCFTLEWERFATVSIEYSFTDPQLDRVVPDSYRNMIIALNKCMQMGISRVGLALKDIVEERNEGLLSAAYLYQLKRNKSLRPLKPLITASADPEGIRTWILRERPQAIISSNLLLPAIERCLATLGISIPTQMGIINLNADGRLQTYTGISIDMPTMGSLAMTRLADKLNYNQFGIPHTPVTIQNNGRWIDGETLLPAAGMAEHTAFAPKRG